jgi:hypothetical protein
LAGAVLREAHRSAANSAADKCRHRGLFSRITDLIAAFAARDPRAIRRCQKIAYLRIVWGATLE